MPTERPVVERLELAGYKSIRQAHIDLTKLNVLIGANGTGKSNLISFFAMLRASLNGKLDDFVGSSGGPDTLFHLGTKNTSEIVSAITVSTKAGRGTFHQRLGFRPPSSLFYSSHRDSASDGADGSDEVDIPDAHTHVGTVTKTTASGHPAMPIYFSLRDRLGTYHIVDTSLNSTIRKEGYLQDNWPLHPDGANLAAMLYLYKTTQPHVYQRIRSTVRKIAPSFDDFVLEPQRLNPNNILLNWRRKGSDYLLGPHQISDGTLRAMALTTLLLQPAADLPDLLLIDEPELGLHPLAITIIAGLLRAASIESQVIVSTQSAEFLDNFSADEIIVVDSDEGNSTFRRLDASSLKDWLEEYSVGELWQKNVIGGGPMP